MSTSGYYRFPTISDTTIVFVSEDDLSEMWTAGGIARRLTSNLGATTYPMLSPDCTQLAFVGRKRRAGSLCDASRGGLGRGSPS